MGPLPNAGHSPTESAEPPDSKLLGKFCQKAGAQTASRPVAEAISTILDDPILATRLGAGGRQVVASLDLGWSTKTGGFYTMAK